MRRIVPVGSLVALGVFLAVPSTAQTVSPEPAAVSGSQGAFSLVLNEGKRLAGMGRHYDAILLFNRVLSEGDESAPYFQEAQYEMGASLFALRFYVSARIYFERVAEAGPQHVRYKEALPYLVRIHREIPGETDGLFRLSSYSPDLYPLDLAEEASFYVGQWHYYEGNLDAALESLSRVGASRPDLFVRATYLRGVVHVRRNEARQAAEAFQEVLRFLETAGSFEGKNRYREMALIGMARVFYSDGQNNPKQYQTAIRYYEQIPEDSEQWLDSLFERSWAYYMIGDHARALGNLLTVSSPYFEEEYYPEALVLRAMIFFKNCRYEEALATIDPFYKEYFEIHKELEQVLARYTVPVDFYQYLASLSVGRGPTFSLKMKKIFNAALADAKLRRLFGYVVTIGREIAQVEALRSNPVAKPLVQILLPELLNSRSLAMSESGQLAQERLGRVRKELKSLLSQGLKVRFESLNAQKGLLRESVRRQQVTGTASAGVRTDGKKDPLLIQWPWDGEYWKDELGSYRYPLQSSCGGGNP
ncbi:hypothetical protein KBD49_06115 [Myxococcota bacterium]|nr:hypothetical protein [Myxococcota bacterium]